MSIQIESEYSIQGQAAYRFQLPSNMQTILMSMYYVYVETLSLVYIMIGGFCFILLHLFWFSHTWSLLKPVSAVYHLQCEYIHNCSFAVL